MGVGQSLVRWNEKAGAIQSAQQCRLNLANGLDRSVVDLFGRMNFQRSSEELDQLAVGRWWRRGIARRAPNDLVADLAEEEGHSTSSYTVTSPEP